MKVRRLTDAPNGHPGGLLHADDAVVVGDHPGELRWRQPCPLEPLEVFVGRPTGDGATLSDKHGNAVVEELLEELLGRRDADADDLFGLR